MAIWDALENPIVGGIAASVGGPLAALPSAMKAGRQLFKSATQPQQMPQNPVVGGQYGAYGAGAGAGGSQIAPGSQLQQAYDFFSPGADLQRIGLERGREFTQGRLGSLPGEQKFFEESMRQQAGISGQRLGLQEEGVAAERGFTERDLANQLAGVNLNEEQQKQLQMSDATGRGAVVTDLNRKMLGWIGEEANLGRDAANLRADRARNQLDIQARDLGLQRQELQRGLEEGLKRLQIDSLISWDQLMSRLESTDAEDRGIATNLMQQALAAAGLFPGQTMGTGLPSSRPSPTYTSRTSAGQAVRRQ